MTCVDSALTIIARERSRFARCTCATTDATPCVAGDFPAERGAAGRPAGAGRERGHGLALTNISTALKRLPRACGRGLVAFYRLTLSPWIGLECRHLPTCSQYADEALERFGLWRGGWVTLARLCRCHPLGTAGLDFVPAALPPRARWYMPWRYGRWRGTNPEAADP